MRKKTLTAILLFVVFFASAQEKKSDANKFYLKGGLSFKGSNFLGTNDTEDLDFRNETWDNFNIKGGNFELGSLFYIDQFQFSNKFGIGIDVNYLTSNFMFQSNIKNLNGNETYKYFTIGSAVGPVFTYFANDIVAFDLYFKANPVWFSGALYKYENTTMNSEENDGYLGFEGMKYKIGVNVRIDYIQISAEFNPGYSVLKNYNNADEYFGNIGELNDLANSDITSLGDLVDLMVEANSIRKTPMPVFNLSIGFCF